MPILSADGREFIISADAWDAWKEASEPFEMPDDVLRRLLGLNGIPITATKSAAATPATSGSNAKSRSAGSTRAHRRSLTSGTKRSRVASDLLLPESEYELPILQSLVAAGGRRPTREVVDEVGRVLTGQLTEVDSEPIRDGGPPRWQNRVQFTRLRLVKGGFMKADSPRGVWEIAPAGEERIKENMS